MKDRLRDLWWVWFIIAWAVAGAAIYGTASAHAYPVDCRTDWMNNGQDSYTYCSYGPGYERTVTVCYGGSGRCSTREE